MLLLHPMCPPLIECSLMEQKVDQLTKMTAELNRKLLEYLDEGPGRVASAHGGDKTDTHGRDDTDSHS